MNEELKVIISAEISKLKQGLNQAKSEIKGFKGQMEKAGKAVSEALSKVGSGIAKGVKVGATALAGVGTAMMGVSEATREHREDMAKLTSSYDQAGLSAKSAEGVFTKLYGILGETDQAVEASQQIALLATNEQEAAKWAEYGAGVMGTFGDALPVETFYESANETLKLGEATGAFVQMLEGAGVDVEQFNSELAACATEAEKTALMMEYTEKCVGSAVDAYNNATDQIQKNRIATLALTNAFAAMGAAVEPLSTELKMGLAVALKDLLPSFTAVTEALMGMANGVEGSAEQFKSAFANLVTDILAKVNELLPTLATVGIQMIVGMVNGFMAGMPQLIDTVGTVISSIIDAITVAIPEVANQFVTVVPAIVEALVSNIEAIINAGVALLTALIDSIPIVLPVIIAALPQIITGIVQALVSNMPAIVQAGITLLLALVQAIPVVIQALVPMIPMIVQAIVQILIANIPVLIQGGLQLLMGIVMAIPQIIPPLVAAIPQIIVAIVQGLIGGAGQIFDGAVKMFKGIGEAAGDAKEEALNKFEELKKNAGEKFEGIKKSASEKWSNIKSSITNNASGANKEASSSFNTMKSNIESASSSADSTATSKFKNMATQIKSNIGSIKSDVVGKFNEIKTNMESTIKTASTTVLNTFENIKSKITNAINGARDAVQSAVNKIKSIMNFSWSLPKLKLPHISVSGRFSINPPSVPRFSIAWYKKGGVFDSPHLFGYGNEMLGGLGEDGAEAVVPLEKNTKWLDIIADKLNGKSSNARIVLQVDGKTFGEIAVDSINDLTRMRGNLPLAII